MNRRQKGNLITAGLVGFGLLSIGAFAGWRMDVNSRMAKVVISTETQIISTETEIIFANANNVFEITEEEAIISLEILTETEAETETETETESETESETEQTTENASISHENAPISPETISDDNFITKAMTEPIQTISLTPEEEQLLMRVASCEAGNQGLIGMALVMRVVLNRHEAWGMSISDVIYAKGQFSVIGCDKWNSGFIATEAPIALQAVKDGWDGSQGALFFCAPSGRSQWMATTKQYLFTAWGHEFYR